MATARNSIRGRFTVVTVTRAAGILAILSCSDLGAPRTTDVTTVRSAISLPPGWLDTNPVAVGFRDISVANNWEDTAIAIPPNAGGCGSNGGLVVSGNGTGHVAVTTLACAQSGSACTTAWPNTEATHPTGLDDFFYSSDSDIARTLVNSQKRILVARMLRRHPNGPPPDPNNPAAYRGMVAFFESSDCGVTWTEVSYIDPHTWGLGDFDLGHLVADPWSNRVFYVVQDSTWPTFVFISTDGGRNWQPPHSLNRGFMGYRITTMRNGMAYFFGTWGATGYLYRYQASTGGWSSAMTLPIAPVWDVTGVYGGRGMTRIGSFPDGDYLRISYPVQRGTAMQQDLKVAVVKVAGSPPAATVTEDKLITATASAGSIFGATWVETDRFELPSAATENTAMLYWQETNDVPSSTTTLATKAALVRDQANWSPTQVISPNNIPAFSSPYGWSNYIRPGDYIGGAFFYEAGTQTLNFLAKWVENGSQRTNILRVPQSNLPEEQFGSYESLGVPLGGSFFVDAAITAQGTRRDVYATHADWSIRHKSLTSGFWSAWDTVPGGASYFGVAAVASTPSQRDLIAVRSDGQMYYARDLSGWSGWTNLEAPPGLTFNAAPAITTWSPGRLDVFGRATDGAIWHAACDSGCTDLYHWSGWESLGGLLWSGPGAVAWSAGRVDIVGVGTDTSLYHKAYDWCCGWSGWESLGGDFQPGSYAPGIASWAAGRLDLFGRGMTPGMHVYHKSWDWAYGWSTWLSANSITSTAGIGAVSAAANQVDYVTVLSDGAVWYSKNAR